MKIPKYLYGNPIEEWGSQWKNRLLPSARSKVLQKWNASGKKPKPESSNKYTKRRIKEETKRTWRSDVADTLHGIGEGVLALHPYTAIPYYGAKVGQDVINGNLGWQTAVNASIPLFHLSPQAVGLREATNVALEDAANAGSKTARNWRVAREINLNIKNNNIKSPSRYITKNYNYNDDGSVSSIIYLLHDPISGKPLGNGVISSPYSGTKGRPVGWIESENGAKGVSEDIYNVAVEDAKTYGDLGIESGWDLMEPQKTLAVTNKFPHTVIGESEGNPVRLLTGTTNKLLPYFIQLSNHHLVNNNIKYNLKTGNFEEVNPNIINGDKTSLKFFERKPSRISLAERAGIPKGERNNKKIINPDNVYGNLRFIRNIDGFPTIKDGLVQLGNSDKLLTNFTTDLPFRLHDWYPNIPGSTYMVVSPRAFKGKKFYSIKPSDSFLSTVDSKVTPNQVRIISGDPKILAEAERRGMRTLTSDKLQNLFNVGSEITKKEFELGRNGAIRPFANADVAINDFKFRNRFYGEDVPEILSKYPEGVVTPYRAEVDKLITQNIGRPSAKDYLILENMTGLDAGIINKFDSELIKKAKDPLATRNMFEKVYYPVTSQIEEKLMNSIGLYPGPYYSFSNLLKLDKLKGNPIKKKQGGKMNILLFLKNGSGIHIKKKNRGKFTSYCGGKVTDSCIRRAKASGNPTLIKRATFADNARHFKHRLGGSIVESFKLRRLILNSLNNMIND